MWFAGSPPVPERAVRPPAAGTKPSVALPTQSGSSGIDLSRNLRGESCRSFMSSHSAIYQLNMQFAELQRQFHLAPDYHERALLLEEMRDLLNKIDTLLNRGE